jgi:hypothetical protein
LEFVGIEELAGDDTEAEAEEKLEASDPSVRQEVQLGVFWRAACMWVRLTLV